MQKCHKRKIATAFLAKIAVADAKRARMHNKFSRRQEVRYYYCSECHAYHLTSQPDRENREQDEKEPNPRTNQRSSRPDRREKRHDLEMD